MSEIKPQLAVESLDNVPQTDHVALMGAYLTDFAKKKNDAGPTTTYEFMQHRKLQTDDLTKLGNERMLLSTLSELTKREDGKPESALGLLMFDLDSFKTINDTLGHSFGDKVLTFIGEKLPRILRGSDHVARPNVEKDPASDSSGEPKPTRKHGDEFFVITPDLDDTRNGGTDMTREERHLKLAERIESELTVEVMESELGKKLEACGLQFGLSVGTAIYQPGQGIDMFLKEVDANMYNAKQAKKEQNS